MRLRASSVTSVLVVAFGGAVSASSAAAQGATPSLSRAATMSALARPLATAASASIPPELAAFEQAAEALHVNSIRFSATFEEDLAIPLSHSKTLPFDLPVEATGEESTAPRRAKIEIGVLGESTEERVIGETAYVHRLALRPFAGIACDQSGSRLAR